uniref:Myosin motor domain-containing protein n=1 Tax=Macrostomum lignano TaxID=282301 RepID=A0A1I8IIQ8_9PLAT
KHQNGPFQGKYVEIQFSRGGEPVGGKISQFLLEKSRVVLQNSGERNFHIFYQLCRGTRPEMKAAFNLAGPECFSYLNQSGSFDADGIDDVKEFGETLHAMEVMGMDESVQEDIISVLSGILHLGNVQFRSAAGDDQVDVVDVRQLESPAAFLQIDCETLRLKLTSRLMESKWGGKSENINVPLNQEQACYTRDALAKGLEVNVGILDIYGFEVFRQNGFEQFCINYVNEKLQQIFIELTLKAEQEEYRQEGIQWSEIQYFNNKEICEMIESKNPPGIFCVLDDVCATVHAVTEGIDSKFCQKLAGTFSSYRYFSYATDQFTISHYAGSVQYSPSGFCEKNRDALNNDLLLLMQSSSNAFIRALFPEKVQDRSRPTTAGTKIRSQANRLVKTLMSCTPHYIRCIKPNETKKPGDFDMERVKHQVMYLGLKENINVRRAGFAYRRPFDKFLKRYAILTKETWPQWRGDPKEGINHLMAHVAMDRAQWQLGKTKLFIKSPESKAFRSHNSDRAVSNLRSRARDLYHGKKERRWCSLYRQYVGDYIGLDEHPGPTACLRREKLLRKKDKVLFAETVVKYDRRFRPVNRDLLLAADRLSIIGRELVIKRSVAVSDILSLHLSPYQDGFLVVKCRDGDDSLLEVACKTELLLLLLERNPDLKIDFSTSVEFSLPKRGLLGRTTRRVNFVCDRARVRQPDSVHDRRVATDDSARVVLKSSGIGGRGGLTVTVGSGLSNTTDASGPRPSRLVAAGNAPSVSSRRSSIRASRQPASCPRPGAGRETTTAAPASGSSRSRNAGKVLQPPQPAASCRNRRPPSDSSDNSRIRIRIRIPPPILTDSVIYQAVQKPGPPRPPVPRQKPPPPPPTAVPRCVALWAYDAQDTNELSFNVDDVIEIVKKDSAWWHCRLNGREGLLPSNYVREL